MSLQFNILPVQESHGQGQVLFCPVPSTHEQDDADNYRKHVKNQWPLIIIQNHQKLTEKVAGLIANSV